MGQDRSVVSLKPSTTSSTDTRPPAHSTDDYPDPVGHDEGPPTCSDPNKGPRGNRGVRGGSGPGGRTGEKEVVGPTVVGT